MMKWNECLFNNYIVIIRQQTKKKRMKKNDFSPLQIYENKKRKSYSSMLIFGKL
jgi:hypothetical protein